MGGIELNVMGQIGKDSLLQNNQDGDFMYFVHSYYVKPEEKNIIKSTTKYGEKNIVLRFKKYIFACQFHPEKSGNVGLKIYKNLKKVVL